MGTFYLESLLLPSLPFRGISTALHQRGRIILLIAKVNPLVLSQPVFCVVQTL
jgi:hypothetical protein